jgi:hypothetical protein
MLGLVVIAFIAAYLVISGLVIWLAARWARKHNRKGWVWGGLAALVMYNLVFWDWIPTLVMHRYYCATEAGFWVYKTPGQWAKENPGVLETLKPWPRSKIYGDAKMSFEFKGGTVTQFNDRFGSWSKWSTNLNGLLIHRLETGIVDVKKKELLVYSVRFLSGPRGAGVVWKSWLTRSSCDDNAVRKNVFLENSIANQLRMENE